MVKYGLFGSIPLACILMGGEAIFLIVVVIENFLSSKIQGPDDESLGWNRKQNQYNVAVTVNEPLRIRHQKCQKWLFSVLSIRWFDAGRSFYLFGVRDMMTQ